MVLLLKLLEVDLKGLFLSDSRSEVQVHASIVALLEACLSTWLTIVEVPVEVRHLLIVKLASSHAVAEDNATSGLLVQVLLVYLLGLLADYVDLHLVLSAGSRTEELIVSSQHFQRFMIN